MSDLWEQEEEARKVDEALESKERTQEFCMRCGKWRSRYLPHECEGRKND